MKRAFHGQLLGVIAVVAATFAACGGGSDQPSPSPATTPAPPATSTATASPPPTTTPTTAPSPRATATPSPTPSTATPSPTPVAPGGTTFRYDTYDTTGAGATPGSYAFLADPDDTSTVVTTYEALRDGTTTALLIHTTDADGVSRADVYDAAEVGDLFEWHQADDCFVRYTVTEVKPDPTGTVPRKLLAVEWLTYAFTGCSGAIETGGEHRIGWSPANITSPDVTSPIRHGNWLVVPDGWTGVTEEPVLMPNRQSPECEGDPPTTLEEHALGRRPAVPDDWVVERVQELRCSVLWVSYRSADWTASVDVYISRGWAVPVHIPWVDPSAVGQIDEATMIDGHPAILSYDRYGFGVDVRIYHSSGIKYQVQTSSQSLTSNRQAVIDIARSLYDTPSPTPVAPGATTFRYDTYDTTGAVSTPGSYAFLSDPDDASTVVTTYEGLRDGTATALLIHQSDADGLSRAGVYDAVEVGDLFKWRQADDCFVRYRVTDVPAVDATAAHREFGVRWETYVFQGCQTGSLPTSATVTFTAGADLPLDHLGGTSLTDFAVVHGPWQLTRATQSEPGALGNPPAGIAVKQPELTEQPIQFQTPSQYDIGQTLTSLTDIRQLPFWREPTLPPGWMLSHVRISGGNSPEGYEATYSAPGGRYPAVSIRGMHAHWRHLPEAASWLTSHDPPRQVVQELHAVAGRPAIVDYSPSGGQHLPSFPVSVRIYDPSTQCIYEVVGRSGSLGLWGGPAALERLLAIAQSLFQGPDPP